MDVAALRATIEEAFDARDEVGPDTRGKVRDAVDAALERLDRGELRVAENAGDGWVVHQWLKKAVLLSFRLNDMTRDRGAPAGRLVGQGALQVRRLGRGAVPRGGLPRRARVRRAPLRLRRPGRRAHAVLPEPGRYVDRGTMIDTWATVGSCAQIGRNCHISGGTGIGGVLEPLQANPVIIEDDCFVGARPRWPRASWSSAGR
jgi:2,3,4,5-tetrahydropyridine-2-carboxylate N-succinyltransferase